MDLRRLAYFVAVAETQHFGRAAAQLHMSGPPLSQRIRELEAELGVTLFERSSRRVTLTEAGQRLLPQAKAVLAAADRFRTIAAELATTTVDNERSLVLAYCHGSEQLALSSARRFRVGHPDVTVHPVPQTSLRSIDELVSGRLRLGVVRPPVDVDRRVAHRLLARIPGDHVAVPAGHRFATQSVVNGAELDGERVLLVDRADGPSYHDSLLTYCAEVGAAPKWVVHPASQVERMLDMVAMGSGIGWMNAWQAANVRRDGVVIVPLEPVARYDEFHLIWRSDDDDPMIDAFAEVASEVFTTQLPHTPNTGVVA